MRKNLLHAIRKRDLKLTKAQRTRIERCDDPEQLEAWFDRAMEANEVVAIFGDTT